MKIFLVLSVLVLFAFTAEASEKTSEQTVVGKHYKECVAVSLYTMESRELDSIVKNNRTIEKTNLIPEGWAVIGVTEKHETGISNPYIVICR